MKITSTELKLRLGRYLRSSIKSPVVISIRGEKANVLISYDDYIGLLKEAGKEVPMEESCNSQPKV